MNETNRKITLMLLFSVLLCINTYADNNLIGAWTVVNSNDRWIFNSNSMIIENNEIVVKIYNYSIQNNLIKLFEDDENKTQDVIYELNNDNLVIKSDTLTTVLRKQRTYNLTQYDGFEWHSFFINLRDKVFSLWAAQNQNASRRALNLVNAKDYETAREFGDNTMVRPIFILVLMDGFENNRERKSEEIKVLFSNTNNRNMELSQYTVEISRIFLNNDIEAMKRIILFSNNGYEYSKYFE